MTLTMAFTNTKVSLDRSMSQIDGLLEKNGIRESRHTHQRPVDPTAAEGEDARGAITLEFVYPGKNDGDRRGVRITVGYQPLARKITASYTRKTVKGTTPEMAARALFWYLDTKFKSIQYGIEEFDAAFMPHLLMQIGRTLAEEPMLIAEVVNRPESIGRLLLPPPESVDGEVV